MLRACRHLLQPGGRLAGYSIWAPDGEARAVELGPSEVLADTTPVDLHRRAGFAEVTEYDVTAEFRVTCEALLAAGRSLSATTTEERLLPALAEEVDRKESDLQGIVEGLLRRSRPPPDRANPIGRGRLTWWSSSSYRDAQSQS